MLKITGLTFDEWISDKFNVFDVLLLLVSIFEILVTETATSMLSAARALRLLRLFKLARSNYNIKCLISAIATTIQ